MSDIDILRLIKEFIEITSLKKLLSCWENQRIYLEKQFSSEDMEDELVKSNFPAGGDTLTAALKVYE